MSSSSNINPNLDYQWLRSFSAEDVIDAHAPRHGEYDHAPYAALGFIFGAVAYGCLSSNPAAELTKEIIAKFVLSGAAGTFSFFGASRYMDSIRDERYRSLKAKVEEFPSHKILTASEIFQLLQRAERPVWTGLIVNMDYLQAKLTRDYILGQEEPVSSDYINLLNMKAEGCNTNEDTITPQIELEETILSTLFQKVINTNYAEYLPPLSQSPKVVSQYLGDRLTAVNCAAITDFADTHQIDPLRAFCDHFFKTYPTEIAKAGALSQHRVQSSL